MLLSRENQGLANWPKSYWLVRGVDAILSYFLGYLFVFFCTFWLKFIRFFPCSLNWVGYAIETLLLCDCFIHKSKYQKLFSAAKERDCDRLQCKLKIFNSIKIIYTFRRHFMHKRWLTKSYRRAVFWMYQLAALQFSIILKVAKNFWVPCHPYFGLRRFRKFWKPLYLLLVWFNNSKPKNWKKIEFR